MAEGNLEDDGRLGSERLPELQGIRGLSSFGLGLSHDFISDLISLSDL